ncbi:S8 family serine peptidase [Chloracidobacterium aggregatum]|uniref:S8 family serine peptidase n=1 Tax=Chloracidobacterium sp. N TaxID=2821540 RepID=A0ABX8AXQ5_9BACT|nr:S8 family serine peptidase [Chloracidobacterium aggregatum]QUV84138.1 S8 family serine peptidase [Chloracidobacterium sp. 2]QUV87377.1 S8 family serine peptidase [Chloracidobacterium sp. S]QUV90281.1 S8 family serine peptidase [Chloracidobacterium sp. A]QUV93492.1 S8 family serine peptidase [Chloracidobacterium sp. N]QUV96648.1 S8 family serine peptidase [Chloracidobacterium sp. E]
MSSTSQRRPQRAKWLAGLVATAALAGLTALPLVRVSSAPPTDTGKGRRFQLAAPYDFTAETHGHKFITRTADARAEAERLGAQLVADYGTFQLYSTDSDNTSAFGNTSGIEMADEFNVVHLNVPINTTSRGAQELAEAGKAAQERLYPGGKRLHVVQFAGPTRPEWFSALQKTGARIINYLPHNAYLVYGDAASLERVSRLGEDARQTGDTTKVTKSFKQWDGPYLAAFKLDPSTAEVALEGTQRYAVQLVADPDTNQATLQLAESFVGKPAIQKYQIADFVNFIVELPSSALMRLAAQEDVISIMPYTEPTLLDERQNQILINSLTGGIPNLSTPYATFLTAAGFPPLNSTFTSAFVVDVGDQMVDSGNSIAGATTPPPGGPPNHTTGLPPTSHFALYLAGNISQPSRLVYAKWESTTSPTPGTNDVRGCGIGHGTLCAHIIAGNVPASLPRTLPHAESASPNFYYGLGVAPFVQIGSSAIFNSGGTFVNPNFNDMLARSYQYGARISSNSWGAPVSGAYNTSSQAYDFLVRDAQRTGSVFPTPGNQEMVIVFAAGNNGPGAQTVGSPGTAKNVITAGGNQNTRNAGENAENMYGSSSRGPCADGRRKPEVLAPATAVSGGVLQVGTPDPTGPGNPDSCVTSAPLPGTTGYYRASTGTSFACPAVAGGAALVRQYFLNNPGPPFNGTAPSPAMTKAYLMNSAQYMTGTGAGDTLWSNNQGMGRMALDRAFDSAPRVLRDQVPADKFTASGQVRTLAVTFPASGPLRITLAWTDVPGATTGSGPRLVNDLDLQVSVGGDTYRGNNFSGANSTTGITFDRLNNAESVFLPAGSYPAGTPVIIQVSAFNIAGDGVPGDTHPLDQDYALVVYNAQTLTGPLVAFAGQTTAELPGPTNSDGDGFFEPCETLQSAITVTNVGTSTATGVNATITSTTPGVTIVNGSASFGSLGPGGSATGNVTFKLLPTFVPGTTVTINVSITFGPGSGSSTASYTVPTSCPLTPGGTFTFSNPAPITIPLSGPATPYPSTINVSGIPTGHVVTKVTVTINNFNHTWPSDVGVALRGPGGQICVLFNNAIGGSGGVTGRTYTFDQAFPPLPATGFPPSGTYGPNNNSTTRTFAAPLPSPPYNSNLNIFNGLSGASVNGTWELFVQDFVGGDAGNINGGWSIAIQTGTLNCSTTAPCLTNVNPQVQMLIYPSATTALFGCPGYPLQATLVGLLTNIGAAPLSNIAIQVKGLGFPDFTNPNAVILASPNPHRLASADDYFGPCAFTGGQAGSIQTTLNGQPPIGFGAPIGSLAAGQSTNIFFRVYMPSTGPVRLLVDVLAIVGPVSTTESVENQRQVIRTMVVEVSPDANGKMVARVISDEPVTPKATSGEDATATTPARTPVVMAPGRRR